jgi:hypothetical protein
MTTATETRYLTCAETAQLLRPALVAAFPGVKFSVRSSTYSMGASICVSWTDGPRSWEVERSAHQFNGSGFDGMIDLKYSNTHFLTSDGKVGFAHTHGTEGSLGSCPEAFGDPPGPQVELVHLGADSVSCNRHASDFDGNVLSAATWIRAHCHTEGEPPNDRFGEQWVNDLARSMAWSWPDPKHSDEPMEETFDRAYYHRRS